MIDLLSVPHLSFAVSSSCSSEARRCDSTQLLASASLLQRFSRQRYFRGPGFSNRPASSVIVHTRGAPSHLPSLTMADQVLLLACLASSPQDPADRTDPLSAHQTSPSRRISQTNPLFLSHSLSNMFRTPNHIPPNLTPINARVQLLVHQPAHHHIVAPHQVQAVRLLARGLVVALLADNALDRVC